jgi:hypothetical protein
MMVPPAQEEAVAHRTNLPASSAAGPWEALVLDVVRPARPALRVEAAGRGLLVLRQADTMVLMAKVDGDRIGVEYTLTGRFRPPIPPIRTTHAAALGVNDPDGARQARWAHHFASMLTEAVNGRCTPGAGSSAPRPTTCNPRPGRVIWHGDGRISCFRRIEVRSTGSPRTRPGKSCHCVGWRVRMMGGSSHIGSRPGRESSPRSCCGGSVGLDCYVLLDGHDRLIAAITEEQKPPLLALSSVSHREVARDAEDAVNRYSMTVELMQCQAGRRHPWIGGSARRSEPPVRPRSTDRRNQLRRHPRLAAAWRHRSLERPGQNASARLVRRDSSD